ncbi:DUF5830 family protein [Candidatus Pyrohabitans sp.]
MAEPKSGEKKVEQALMLLTSVGAESISVKEAVEIVQLVTTVPELVRRAITTAEKRGLVKREGGRLIIRERVLGQGKRYPEVKRLECDAQCIRCGRRISTCYYLLAAESELGPLGSECIKRLRLIAQRL